MSNKLGLKEFVDNVKNAGRIIIPERLIDDKNLQTRRILGITIEDQKNIVRSVETSDYHQGPMDDKDSKRGGVLWVFKKEAFGEMFYIKLKYLEDDNKVIAISCHIDNI